MFLNAYSQFLCLSYHESVQNSMWTSPNSGPHFKSPCPRVLPAGPKKMKGDIRNDEEPIVSEGPGQTLLQISTNPWKRGLAGTLNSLLLGSLCVTLVLVLLNINVSFVSLFHALEKILFYPTLLIFLYAFFLPPYSFCLFVFISYPSSSPSLSLSHMQTKIQKIRS